MAAKPRVLTGDPNKLLQEGIRLILEPSFDVVGAAEDGPALLSEVTRLNPDLVLLEVSLPVMGGIETARQIRKMRPSAKVVFLTACDIGQHVAEALRAGAVGYILKRAHPSELIDALQRILAGSIFLSPLVAREAMDLLINSSRQPKPRRESLTRRQQEVLVLTAEGKTRKEVAAALHISVKTVEFHKSVLTRELGLRSSADFTLYAVEHGMIRCKIAAAV